jgi:hypothetical protein
MVTNLHADCTMDATTILEDKKKILKAQERKHEKGPIQWKLKM